MSNSSRENFPVSFLRTVKWADFLPYKNPSNISSPPIKNCCFRKMEQRIKADKNSCPLLTNHFWFFLLENQCRPAQKFFEWIPAARSFTGFRLTNNCFCTPPFFSASLRHCFIPRKYSQLSGIENSTIHFMRCLWRAQSRLFIVFFRILEINVIF